MLAGAHRYITVPLLNRVVKPQTGASEHALSAFFSRFDGVVCHRDASSIII